MTDALVATATTLNTLTTNGLALTAMSSGINAGRIRNKEADVYKEEDAFMCYRYEKKANGSFTAEKVFVAPNLVLRMLLKKLELELTFDENGKPIIKGAE